jgi:phage-related protein
MYPFGTRGDEHAAAWPDGPEGHVRSRPVARMQAVYYRDRKGRQPVDAFLDKLEDRKAATIDNQIDRLNDLGPTDPPLPHPWSSQVEGELRELRCHYGPELYRLLYRRSRNLFVLLHILRKDTGKLPRGDVELAKKRWADFKQRMDAERRTQPRAAGKDAP